MEIYLTLENVGVKQSKFFKITIFTIGVKNIQESKKIIRTVKDLKALCYQLKKDFPSFSKFKFSENKFLFKSSSVQRKRELCMSLIDEINRTRNLNKNPYFVKFCEMDSSMSLDKGISSSSDVTGSHNVLSTNANNSQHPCPDFDLGDAGNHKAKVTDFNFVKVIGKGSFGRVYLVHHKEEKKYYAMKVLDKKTIIQSNEIRHIMAERAVLLKTIEHPFLVSLKYSFQTCDKLYFVLKYVNGGELFFHLQREGAFLESRAKFYAAEIGHGLGYLHSKNIIYRDLKPENILIDSDGHIALTDFGLAKQLTHPSQTATTFCGTPEYLAPEIIVKKPYDKSVDWWCFGCVIYEMISGLPPFYCRNTDEMYNRVITAKIIFNDKFSSTAKNFLDQLLQKDPTKRLGYGPKDFDDVKEHNFLKRINWNDLYNKKIKPPYVPEIENELDLKNIDEEFTSEEVTASVQNDNLSKMLLDNKTDKNPFVGFTYVSESNLQ